MIRRLLARLRRHRPGTIYLVSLKDLTDDEIYRLMES